MTLGSPVSLLYPTHPSQTIDTKNLLNMPSDYTVIDDNPPDTWDNAFWIRQDNPRKYPTDESDIPAVVKAQRETMLRLPKAANSLLPHDFLAILNFVHDADMYPRLRQAVIISPIKFSPLPPDTNPHAIVKALRGRTVPPLEAIREARKNLGQEWFNGNVSVIDSHYADYPLPFWVLTLWYELHFVHKDRLKWASTEERIRSASVSINITAQFQQAYPTFQQTVSRRRT